jgi:O-acetyl-ADP-ribose deacetylase (regulator of RNase III)
MLKVTLIDLNRHMVRAWRESFADHPEVEIEHGSLLAHPAGAWVSPTNARGSMDGGLDGALHAHFGPAIQARVRREIVRGYDGYLPIGHAVCVETGALAPAWLVSTPTMGHSAEDVSATLNVALACAGALQAVHQQNRRLGASIRSVALPGLGAGTGQVPVEVCAELMRVAYELFLDREFEDFEQVRAALACELGDLDPWATRRPARASGLWVA